MKYLLLLLFILMPFTLSACEKTPQKEWTFLVYLNGDNNLNSYGDKDVAEMMKVGSTDQVNIVVLRDFGKKQTSKLLYVNKGSTTTAVDYKKNVDTGDYRTLIDFFKYSSKNYPAKHYAVVIWDHGNGWMDLADETTRGISYDDSSGNHISTTQLGLALNEMKSLNDGNNIDILGMDACLMAMAEVIYEVKGTVDYLVGSEETEPGNGWDYVGALAPLTANNLMDPRDFSINLVNAYVDSYPSNSVTQSSVDVAEFSKVVDKVNSFVTYSQNVYEDNKSYFQDSLKLAQSFSESSYKDFGHFLSLLSDRVTDQTLRDYTLDLKNSLESSVVISRNTYFDKSTGISVWLPQDMYNMNSYKKLMWSKETSWASFIETLQK